MSQTPPTILPPRRGRWRTVALVAVVFVSGIVVGAGGATVAITHGVRKAIQQPDVAAERVAERIRRRLDLTPDQARSVRAILTKRQREMARIRADVQPRVRQELEGVRTEVADVLDAKQRERWDELYEDFSQRWMPAGKNAKAR